MRSYNFFLLLIFCNILLQSCFSKKEMISEDTIKDDKLKITKLAQGLPVGGEIEQLDDGTLFSAFKNRVPVTGN